MDYKEKYEEALERMRYVIIPPETKEGLQTLKETVFPELAESKDERIRKEIVEFIQWAADRGSVPDEQLQAKRPGEWLAYLEKQKEPTDKGEVSDGYHTFNELYYYRMLYNAAFFNLLPKGWVHKSKKHHDGEECFGGGWFIVMANLPTGQISNHYELKDWDLFQIPEKEVADEWDGHTPQEAAERLYKYLQEKQKEQKLAEKQDYSGLNDLERAILRGFLAAGVENVPVGIIKDTASECIGFLALIDDKPAGWTGYRGIAKHPELSNAEWAIVRGFSRIAGHSHFPITIIKETAQDFLAHLPAEWREEDENTVYFINEFLGYHEASDPTAKSCKAWLNERLKYIRPQPQWKPSEEQIKALDKAIPVCMGVVGRDEIAPLESLYDDLKKL